LSAWADVHARKYEFGVLRFLGASKAFVLGIVFTEAVAASLAGALLAMVISQSLLTCLNFISAAEPSYSVGFNWYLAVSSTVIGAAIGGSTIPFAISIQEDVLHLVMWDR
jgi:cell division protein FtsX